MVAKKKPAARGAQQTPKKGTLRLLQSNEVKRGTHGKRPGYTPADQKDDPQPPRGREKLEITGGQLKALTPSKLYPKLCCVGHVPDLKDNKCLACGVSGPEGDRYPPNSVGWHSLSLQALHQG